MDRTYRYDKNERAARRALIAMFIGLAIIVIAVLLGT